MSEKQRAAASGMHVYIIFKARLPPIRPLIIARASDYTHIITKNCC